MAVNVKNDKKTKDKKKKKCYKASIYKGLLKEDERENKVRKLELVPLPDLNLKANPLILLTHKINGSILYY